MYKTRINGIINFKKYERHSGCKFIWTSWLFELRKIADKHGLFLVEDNAQAPGAQIEGKFTGTIGDVGVFSFNRHKVIQSGEGE